MKTPGKDNQPFPLDSITLKIDARVKLEALIEVLPKMTVVLTSGSLIITLAAEELMEPIIDLTGPEQAGRR